MSHGTTQTRLGGAESRVDPGPSRRSYGGKCGLIDLGSRLSKTRSSQDVCGILTAARRMRASTLGVFVGDSRLASSRRVVGGVTTHLLRPSFCRVTALNVGNGNCRFMPSDADSAPRDASICRLSIGELGVVRRPVLGLSEREGV